VSARLDDLVTVEAMAERLGVAPSTLREWCRRSRFPNVKLPGTRRVMIPLADAEAYIGGAALETRQLPDGGRLVQPARRTR
jgi:excisionase family DNA binding protein